MSSTPSQFQNENLTVNLKKDPGCKVRAEIIVSPTATKASYEKALKTINKEISIPGFRKGKAPSDLIKKNYGKHVEKEWKDLVLNTAFEEALKLTKIMPFDNKSVTDAGVNSLSLEDGASLYVVYETAPEIPSIDPHSITLNPIEERKIEDKDLERAIDDMLLQQAQWTDIHDRPVQEGDFIDIDIDKIDEPSYNLCKNARFEVAQGKMGSWMRKLVIGRSSGESVEGMSEKEESLGESQEFKPTLCRILIRGIKTVGKPNLDDEFAKKLKFSDLEDLKSKLKDNLIREARDEAQQQMRTQIENKLIENYHFDIPQSLIKEHLAQSQQNIANAAKAQASSENVETEINAIQSKIAQKIEHSYRLYFLTRKIAQDNNIQVSQDELMQEMLRQVWLQASGQSIIDQSMDPADVRTRLHTHVLTNKAIDFLIENASKLENK